MAKSTPDKAPRDVYQMVTDRIVSLLEKGVAPWRKPWKVSGNQRTSGAAANLPRNIEGRPYRGINIWLLMSCGYESPYWMTFNQAKERGGSVRKGEKGTFVIFWRVIERLEEQADGTERLVKIPMLRYYTVFNLEQTEGVRLPKAVTAPVSEPVSTVEPIDAAAAVVEGMPQRPEIRHGGGKAFYNRMSDFVGMPPVDTFGRMEGYYTTLFHELGHATGHEDRLARKELMEGAVFGSYTYGSEELTAEFTAAFLCGETGISPATIEHSAAYLQSWIATIKADKKLVVIAAARAQAAADFILNRSAKTAKEADQVEEVA